MIKSVVILAVLSSIALGACRREVPHVPYKTERYDQEVYYKK